MGPAARLQFSPVSELWDLVEEIFQGVCTEYNAGRFSPLLEADVVGHVYHLLVTKLGGDASCVHLGTRLFGSPKRAEYDLVMGECISTEEQRRSVEALGEQVPEGLRRSIRLKGSLPVFRPAIRGRLVLEFKMFAIGFDCGQLGEHVKQAVKDVTKLGALKDQLADRRAAVLFDDEGYLQPPIQQKIVGARLEGDTDLRVYIFQREKGVGLKWWRL